MEIAPATHKANGSGYVLCGLTEIAAVFGRHPATIRRWIATENLPAPRLPNGQFVTSFGLLDAWLMSRATEGDN